MIAIHQIKTSQVLIIQFHIPSFFFVYTENGIARTAGIILKIDINFLASLW
jgi:hypothetical protein